MGVWIETKKHGGSFAVPQVTPCMGVWIETYAYIFKNYSYYVTPCMGVWIETLTTSIKLSKYKSHPVWVCGLKQCEGRNLSQVG